MGSTKFYFLFFILIIGFLLRIDELGYTFASGDNAELAHRILERPGWYWIKKEPYGILIGLLVKLHVLLVSAFDIPLTEWMWRLPVAMVGTATPLLGFFLSRRWGMGDRGALLVAAFLAVYPIHVFHSRYLWGYEILGTFFALIFVFSLIEYFTVPSRKNAWWTSLSLAIYLNSHGYTLPMFGFILIFPMLYCPERLTAIHMRYWCGLKKYFYCGLWIPLVLMAPLYRVALSHAKSKKTEFGFYFDHLEAVVQNVGIFFVLVSLIVLGMYLFQRLRENELKDLLAEKQFSTVTAFLILAGGYLAPIFFGTPPGLTMVRNYLIIGPLFFVLAGICCFVALGLERSMRALALFTSVFFLTAWGTLESYRFLDTKFDPSLVTLERGALIPDPGIKAMAFLYRKKALYPEEFRLLLVSYYFQPSNIYYYFGKPLPDVRGFIDLDKDDKDQRVVREHKDWATLIAIHPKQYKKYNETLSDFSITQRYYDGDKLTLLLLHRGAEKRRKIEISGLNKRFDAEFTPNLLRREK